MRIFFLTSVICLQLLHPSANAVARSDRVDRMIIKYKDSAHRNHQASQKRASLQRGPHKLSRSKLRGGNNVDLYYLEQARTVTEAQELARELMRDPEVEYAEPDYRRYPAMVPNDPGYPNQWYLKLSTLEPGAINAERAWDETTGSASIVIAVIDSGILPHEDLDNARVLPGYDFITDVLRANDANGRDADPTDPGDWITDLESDTQGTSISDCDAADSSWHGTKVSGVILAGTDNLQGIAGLDHQASLLPVRALGKCGGSSFDIADAIYWAAGLPVPGVPLNPNPAHVINLSLGSPDSSCSSTEQAAINAAVGANVVVIAAAGNDGQFGINSPAKCDNVIAVGATSRDGAETCYTNVGDDVDLSAPGGNDGAGACSGNDFIASISNNGTTDATDNNGVYDPFLMGTSFSTPLVAGAAALIKAIDAGLTPTTIETILKNTAQDFPTGTGDGLRDCTKDHCGEGILDVYGAIIAARNGGLDSVPNPFTLEDQESVEPNKSYTSNSITVTGIDTESPISIGGSGEYSIDNGSFTNAPGIVTVNQEVRVRVRSSAQSNSTQSARLTIGGISESFTLKTRRGSGGGGAGSAWLLPLCALWLLRRRATTFIVR